ncbi:LOW QUALITY PROTEIN: uncharacterized protein LOC116917782 [Daphnia magna]|uniref:LOW QUALITY PROTEIN: uncharacterized protein LOC116917782 n=1 Tax=Daphnia magna TaxID=35525 RepID=UPI001E1BCD5C|nr:LOW QUALITY PROTEIN: uncharacterized protein LOC116917782 [Daphnia magna]
MVGMPGKMKRVNGLQLLLVHFVLMSFLAIVSSTKDNCYNGPPAVIVNQDADVYLGVLLNVREMDMDTPGKCGTGLHREAIELYESLRWYLSFINQNSGQVASRLVKDSFIPGIQLGLKIFDACGDADLAERQLGVLFPELLEEEEANNCKDGNGSNEEEQDEKPMLGLIDFVGLVEEDPEIGEQLASFSIPFMAVRLDDFLPADEVAEALVRFSKQMLWDKVAVVYADDDYSLAITKSVSLKAEEMGVCFESFTPVSADDVTMDAAGNSTAVLVISPPEDAQNVTRRLSLAASVGHRGPYQWLFSHPWSAEKTDLLAELTGPAEVYAVAVSPIIVDQFESYWLRRKTPILPAVPENLWFLEYMVTMKKCQLESIANITTIDPSWLLCHNFNFAETSLERVLRNTRVLPAVHVLNVFASAFRKARDSKCGSENGYCQSLRELTRKEFLDDVFHTLQLQHASPGNRVPAGFVGSKKPSSNKISDVKFSLIRSAEGDQIRELFSYHKSTGTQTIDRSFQIRPSQCPVDGCSDCVYFQSAGSYRTTPSTRNVEPAEETKAVEQYLEGDLEPEESIISVNKSSSAQQDRAHQNRAELKDDQESDSRSKVIQQQPQESEEPQQELETQVEHRLKITDIIIPALFAVHKAGPTPLQCSAEVDPNAIQDVEAFLWALDVVNRNTDLLNGIEIGAVVFDTCSSPVKAAHLVSSVLAKEGDPMLEEINIDPDQLLAVVSATSGDETEAVTSVLAPNLITTVSAKERSDTRLTSAYHLQVPVPMSVAARVVIDLLNYSGWTYVSVVYSSHDVDSVTGFRHFQQLAENTQICVGLIEKLNRTSRTGPVRASRSLDRVFEQLATKMDLGGRVVILWTDEMDTQSILAKMHLLSPEQADKFKQLTWISANGWITGGKVQNFVKDVGRWLVVRPQVQLVKEFAEHFARLRPENNERNPWYGEYFDQMAQCQQSGECSPVPRIHPSTTTVIQTVYVVASGLARLIQDYCPDQQLLKASSVEASEENDGDLCATNTTTFRENLLAYLQNTGTDRPGDVNGEFGFTDHGYGDTPMEIVEVRGGFAEFTFIPMATYDQDVLQFSSDKNSTSDVVMADVNNMAHDGLLSLVSECSAVSQKEVCWSSCAAKQQNQMLIKASKDRMYIMGLFDVREKSRDGLYSCSTNVTTRGIQQTEAFVWALEQVNQMADILPGIQLGAIGLDGCGTQEKRSAEIARAFSTAAVQSGIAENQILGLVVGTPDADPRVLFELHNRQQLPIVLSVPGLEMQQNLPSGTSPSLIQLSPSTPMMGKVLSDILHLMNWTYVSSICSNQVFPYNAVCEEFQNFASKNDVQLAVDLAVNEQPHLANYWENVASMIYSKAQNGAHVLVALLPDRQIFDLLTAIRKLPPLQLAAGQSIILVTLSTSDNKQVMEEAIALLSGVVHIRSRLPMSGKFFQDYDQMKFSLSTSNPWLMKYWSQMFHCRGATCQNRSLNQLAKSTQLADSVYDRDESVSNTINGVLAIAQGLERVRQELCPGVKQGICPAMENQDVRQRLERAIAEHGFTDITGRPIKFLRSTGVSQEATVEILNTHHTKMLGTEQMVAGSYSLREGLVFNAGKLKARDASNASVSISAEKMISQCLNCVKITPKPQWHPSTSMQVQPGTGTKPGFSLVGLLPFHRQGSKPLSCGTMHSPRIFQNLAAVAMALDRLKQNRTIPPSLQIGAIIFDSCGRVERAQQRLLSFISDAGPSTSSQSSVIGAVTLDGETAHAIANVLSEANIPQFSVDIDSYRSTNIAPFGIDQQNQAAALAVGSSKEKTWHSLGGNQIIQTVPTPEDEVKALFDIVRGLAWKHAIIFYDDSQAGSSDRDLFLQLVRQSGNEVCIGAQVRVNKFGQAGETVNLHSLLEAIASDLPVLSVAVLLLDNPAQVQHVLQVLDDVGLSNRFVVLANHAWGNHHDILFHPTSGRKLAGVLTVSMETYLVPGFNQFLAGMTLENHSTIPTDWFEEYFQHHFECHLLGSKVSQRMYPKSCTGSEYFELAQIEQDPYVYHTMAAVETYVKALHEFLQLYCSAGTEAAQFGDCGPNSQERFNAVLNDMIKREPYSTRQQQNPLSPGVEQQQKRSGYRGVVVWNVQYYSEKSAHYERVGFWRHGRLEVDQSQMKFYVPYAAVPSIECLQGTCMSVCSAQASQSQSGSSNNRGMPTQSSKSPTPEVPTNFATAWGVVAIIFCVLGLLSCMACASFFIRNMPRPTPNSVLSYFILAGIALLYITTIFFLIQPSDVSCGLRRFFLGLSYAIIYSGLVVRTVHAWRRINRGTNVMTSTSFSCSSSTSRSFDLTDATKPPGLVFTTMTLVAVQVILLSAWLIFKPPEAVPSPMIQLQMQQYQGGALWRCSPAENFESELVISLILPIILLFTATLFSFVVWRSSDAPRDSRSTTACCALLAFFTIIWTLVATQASYKAREPAIVVGNILCAKTILLILYGRKVYEISVHRQESRNLAVLSQFTSKCMQPSLHNFPNNRCAGSSVYTTDLDMDLPGGHNESFAANAEDPAMGLCLGLSTSLSRHSSRRGSPQSTRSMSRCYGQLSKSIRLLLSSSR